MTAIYPSFSSLILLAALLFSNSNFAQPSPTSLEEDLDLMMNWFGGEFDNFQQVWKEKEDEVVDSLRHEHLHSIFMPVEMPLLGQHTFFVKQYLHGDTSNIYRQRVYHFFANPTEAAIQLDIYSFKNSEEEQQYAQANHQPELLQKLSAKDFRQSPGCAVYWKKEGEHFVGYMKDRACHFPSRRSGKEIYVTDSLRLTSDQIWIRDEAYDAEGNYVFGHKGGIAHQLKRCRFFKGWMAVQKEPESEDYFVMRNIRLHDQGHKLQLIDVSGEATPFHVELSEVIYRSGIEVLKLAIYETGKKKSVAYVWTNIEAERIGINMRSITAGFSLAE